MAGSIIVRLRSGVPKDEVRNPFARDSLPAYTATITVILAAAAMLAARGMTAEPSAFLNLSYPAWLWVGGVMAKRVGHHRVGTLAEAVGIVGVASFFFVLLQAGLTTIALPDADALLISADRLVGFDWKRTADWLHPHQEAMIYITAIYRSIVWQPPIILACLCYANRTGRLWTFVLAWLVSLAIVMMIYPFLPAQGGFLYYHFQPEAWPGRLSDDPWRFGPVIHALRDSGVRHLQPGDMTGLVSFPSFHVAAAVLLGWAARPLRIIGPIALVLNIGMALAAIICGPHYLVDVIGGAAIALLAIVVAKSLVRTYSTVNSTGLTVAPTIVA